MNAPDARTAGFTLVELLAVLAIIGLAVAIVVPNIGALVPSARLDGSGSAIRRRLDWVRSEARIQGKRMALDFDLDKARWRIVHPPEQRMTSDQDQAMLDEWGEEWFYLEDDVMFGGAGDARHGMAEKGVYRLQFDEYGFTADQMIVLTLKSDPKLVWSLSIQGLSGQVHTERDEEGHTPQMQFVQEGAF